MVFVRGEVLLGSFFSSYSLPLSSFIHFSLFHPLIHTYTHSLITLSLIHIHAHTQSLSSLSSTHLLSLPSNMLSQIILHHVIYPNLNVY